MARHKKLDIQTNNIYLYLSIKLLTALGLLLICQLFFYIFNTRIFHPEGFRNWVYLILGNLHLGCATVCTFLLPYIVLNLIPTNLRWNKIYHCIGEVFYILGTIAILLPTLVDTAYFQFTYRRLSGAIFSYLTVGGNMGSLIPMFLSDYWYVTLVGIGVFAILTVAQSSIHLKPRTLYTSHTANDIIGAIVGLSVTFILMRGGFQKHWLEPQDSARYAVMKETALVENSAYNILRTLGPTEPAYYNGSTTVVFNPLQTPLRNSTPTDTTEVKSQPKNIVIIVLEGFSQEYMGCYNNGIQESFTPFLDSLARLSTLYQGRSNGKESIEAIPAIFASIPSLTDKPFIMSNYFNDTLDALPAILARHGYHTAFFHGCYNGSMNFDKFCAKAGFQEYYGKNEYGNDNDYDGAWGIFDEPFLQFTANKLNTFGQPFMAGIFTVSAHHPYAIPEQHKGQFKKGEHPILECVMYSDYALRQFFRTASQQEWYNNTLFIITADHPAQGLHREYNDYDGWYRTPMIMFDPSNTTPKSYSRMVQQIDIMPSVIDYLGIKEPCICFGKSILRPDNKPFHIVYGNGYLQLTRPGETVLIKGGRIERHGTAPQGEPDGVEMINAILKEYNDRLAQNRLTPPLH